MSLERVVTANFNDYLKLATLGAIWGGAFHLINIAILYFSPLQIALMRVALGAATVALVILIGARRTYWPTHKQWVLIVLSSFLSSTFPYYLINWGSQSVSGSEASLLIGAGPFLSLILSHFLTDDERFNIYRLMAVILGFIGLLFVFMPDFRATGFIEHKSLHGKIAIILAACCYAVGAIVGRYIAQLPTLMTAFYLMLISMLVLLPFSAKTPWPLMSTIPLHVILALLFLGVIATGLAINIRLNILRKNGAVFMSQVVYLIPIFGVFWGIVSFGDQLSWHLYIALVFVVLGLIVMKKAGTQR